MNATVSGPEATTDRSPRGPRSLPEPLPGNPSPPAPSAEEDFLPLRARLGRMLGRPKPLLPEELHQANLSLMQLIEAPDPAQYLLQHHPILPPAVQPLLLTLLAAAWADADTGLACALEKLHRLLIQPPAPHPID